ncbi:MAG TPA: hypothetical protein VIS48_01315 [Candidatus Kryptonia bacterium]
MNLPALLAATTDFSKLNRLFIGAYGFEDRALGWPKLAKDHAIPLNSAIMFRYIHAKGKNRVNEVKDILSSLGCSQIGEIKYDVLSPMGIEDTIGEKLAAVLQDVEEIIVDITAMTKFLILVLLCGLAPYEKTLRIIYSEAEEYAPSESEYTKSRSEMGLIAKFPSRGSESILRARCLSSIRMQGQPVTMVAFTSFNEQLVRHMLGTLTPHRLIFLNGRPARADFKWRELATQEIHSKLIEQYSVDNPLDEEGRLTRTVSTLDYRETVQVLKNVYDVYGFHERLIIAATGGKMQTVGLYLHKMIHPDTHVEYPTPDSYYVTGMSKGIRMVHEVGFQNFSSSLRELRESNSLKSS